MLLIDVLTILVILFATGFVVTGIVDVREKRKLKDRETVLRLQAAAQQKYGTTNVVKLALDKARLCGFCDKMTDPAIDLFIDGGWVHVKCYEETT